MTTTTTTDALATAPIQLVEPAIDELFAAAMRLRTAVAEADWHGDFALHYLYGRVDGLRQAHGYDFQEAAECAWSALDGARQSGRQSACMA